MTAKPGSNARIIERYNKVWALEHSKGTPAGERAAAKRQRIKMEGQHPGLRRAAAKVRERAERGPGDAQGPGPYDTGAYGPKGAGGPGRAPQPPPVQASAWVDMFKRAAVNVVGGIERTLNMQMLIQGSVVVASDCDRDHLFVTVTVPLRTLDIVSASPESAAEFARQVGGRVAHEIKEALSDLG